MEKNLILEGLLSMVTELKEKQEDASQSGGNSRKTERNRTGIVGTAQQPGYSRKRFAGYSKPT